jgi:uncharacterized protein YyaL (SSP411 family)
MDTAAPRPALPSAAEIAKLPSDGGPKWNRLVFEQSPYLLQHAANPVDWRPWGDEAFAEAARRDVPVFLSIGYSTCHWCHVMEHESFEDAEVAALLNEHFVPVKVDREERPDVDHLYMTVTQAMTGSGGWPMTVLLTPDRRPFFAGTYFPKEGRFNRPGMMQLVPHFGRLWKENREGALATAGKVVAAIDEMTASKPGPALDAGTLETARKQLMTRYDPVHGGFGNAPKFPSPHQLNFLLRSWKRDGDPATLAAVESTLDAMRRGGIFDHVGHGFARYSTDREWLLPHFEKMLYDQALLLLAYAETYLATGRERHAEVAREIMDYVLRDMTAPEGGFYSAEDADSEGVEGKFYVWTPEQLKEALGDELGAVAIEAWGVVEGGNFADQATGSKTGESILHFSRPLPEIAAAMKTTPEKLATTLEKARVKLFETREKRIHPLKDDKILTNWNGLMIAAAARAGAALDEAGWIEAADRAADFAWKELRDAQTGRLHKRWRRGDAAFPAVLDDYAFFAWGLIELHQATQEPERLAQAAELTELTLKHFGDPEQGGFFLTADDGEQLFLRAKEVYDGAEPSGNSVTCLNLLRLASLLARPEWEAEAERSFQAFAGAVAQGPAAHSLMMQALDLAVGPRHEVVIAGDPEAKDTQALLRALRSGFHPGAGVLLRTEQNAQALAKLAPYTKRQTPMDGKATAYVCLNQACHAPTNEAATMLALLAASPEPGKAPE